MQIKDFLKKKFEHIFIICVAIIVDVIPIIAVMAGFWIVKYFSMVILYISTVVLSLKAIYKLFKEGE